MERPEIIGVRIAGGIIPSGPEGGKLFLWITLTGARAGLVEKVEEIVSNWLKIT